ncbi:mitochondrial ribosomal subunit S27-domain-containing protein [Flagelloscypha sp. PMI_526]|nr:mitochondrial ribosomal subunit S27-domain-containing protein [Flagelloscypha sp. PMI_526]
MRVVARSTVAALEQLRCQVFQTSYNPTGIRTGAKYLRRRMRGPALLSYYPPDVNLATLARSFPELELRDDDEETRIQDVEEKKARGKGAPKKAKTKADSRRAAKGKKR